MTVRIVTSTWLRSRCRMATGAPITSPAARTRRQPVARRLDAAGRGDDRQHGGDADQDGDDAGGAGPHL